MGQQCYPLANQEEMANMKTEVKGILQIMVNILPIALVVVVNVVFQMILTEVAQIIPLPLNLEGDVDMIDVLNNVNNSSKV